MRAHARTHARTRTHTHTLSLSLSLPLSVSLSLSLTHTFLHLPLALWPPLPLKPQGSSRGSTEESARLAAANARRGEGWPGSWRFSQAGRAGLALVGLSFLIATCIQLQGEGGGGADGP